jgi:hypothetical protein
MCGRGVMAGSSYELDAAQSIQSKFFFSYFGPSGRLLMEGLRAFQIPFFETCNEKKTYDDIFERRLLKTK